METTDWGKIPQSIEEARSRAKDIWWTAQAIHQQQQYEWGEWSERAVSALGLVEQARRVVVTRHQGLVDYIVERGIINPRHTPIFPHVEKQDVDDKDVIGILPLHLASFARSVTVIPLHLASEDRGKELTAERVAEIAGEPRVYVVQLQEEEK